MLKAIIEFVALCLFILLIIFAVPALASDENERLENERVDRLMEDARGDDKEAVTARKKLREMFYEHE